MTSHPEWQFVIDAAAHASGLPAEQIMAGGKPIKGNEHSRSLHDTRQAVLRRALRGRLRNLAR